MLLPFHSSGGSDPPLGSGTGSGASPFPTRPTSRPRFIQGRIRTFDCRAVDVAAAKRAPGAGSSIADRVSKGIVRPLEARFAIQRGGFR